MAICRAAEASLNFAARFPLHSDSSAFAIGKKDSAMRAAAISISRTKSSLDGSLNFPIRFTSAIGFDVKGSEGCLHRSQAPRLSGRSSADQSSK